MRKLLLFSFRLCSVFVVYLSLDLFVLGGILVEYGNKEFLTRFSLSYFFI